MRYPVAFPDAKGPHCILIRVICHRNAPVVGRGIFCFFSAFYAEGSVPNTAGIAGEAAAYCYKKQRIVAFYYAIISDDLS